MKVFLKQDVAKVGKAGEIVEVKVGYAKNYLIAKNLATQVTEEVLNEKKSKDEAFKRKQGIQLENFKKSAKVLNGGMVEIAAKVGETGQMFGSIKSEQVAEAINSKYSGELSEEINKKQIEMEEIKELGSHKAVVKFFKDIKAEIEVKVFE